jgi:hypothetical protein
MVVLEHQLGSSDLTYSARAPPPPPRRALRNILGGGRGGGARGPAEQAGGRRDKTENEGRKLGYGHRARRVAGDGSGIHTVCYSLPMPAKVRPLRVCYGSNVFYVTVHAGIMWCLCWAPSIALAPNSSFC